MRRRPAWRRHLDRRWHLYLLAALLLVAVAGIVGYGVSNGDPPDMTCRGTGRYGPAVCRPPTTTLETP